MENPNESKLVLKEEEDPNQNWSEAAEDLVTAGNTEAAISLLETVISKLESTNSPSQSQCLQLASALTELANLYSANRLSLKSDDLLSRASLLKLRALQSGSDDVKEETVSYVNVGGGGSFEEPLGDSSKISDDASAPDSNTLLDGDDDWEAIADRAPSELLSPPELPSVSNLSLQDDAEVLAPKRRGRGTFSYKQDSLYSDKRSDVFFSGEVDDHQDSNESIKENSVSIQSKYGTQHVLVLADFSPSTKTIDLEKLFQDFTDHGVSIRWVNDTTALAVFRTPSLAHEAMNRVQFPFTVRILEESDNIFGSIPHKDLEPPQRRPQTSTRTAQRLIAQGMGLKLGPLSFGSRELKNQEEARKNRIVTRQKMIEDAWGGDDN